MDKLVGVGLQRRVAVVFPLRCAAERTLAVLPVVLRPAKADVALGRLETRNGILAVWILRTIERSPREEARQLRDGDAEELLVEDVVKPLLQVGDLRLKPHDEPPRDLAQEDAALARRVEERRRRIAEEFLRQQVEHPVRDLRRREHLVVREIRQTAQHIGIVSLILEIQHLSRSSDRVS